MASLTRDPIQVVHDPCPAACGARVTFEGLVRRWTNGVETAAIEYDAYEPMALPLLASLEQEAQERFGSARVEIIHRLGLVPAGQSSVVVVVESAHRRAAFDACAWVMDEIKSRAPIWKKEIGPTGETWHHPSQGILKTPAP